VALEVAMGAGAAGVDDTLGDTLMVEVGDLLAHDEVFEQRGPPRTGLEGVLVIGDLHPLVGAQGLAGGVAAKRLQALHLGIGVGPVGGRGTGDLAFPGHVLLLAGHGSALLISLERARIGLVQLVTGRRSRAFNRDYQLSRYAGRIGS